MPAYGTQIRTGLQAPPEVQPPPGIYPRNDNYTNFRICRRQFFRGACETQNCVYNHSWRAEDEPETDAEFVRIAASLAAERQRGTQGQPVNQQVNDTGTDTRQTRSAAEATTVQRARAPDIQSQGNAERT